MHGGSTAGPRAVHRTASAVRAPRQRSLMSIYRETLEHVIGQGGKECVHMHAHRTQTVVMCRYAHTCARVQADIPSTRELCGHYIHAPTTSVSGQGRAPKKSSLEVKVEIVKECEVEV